MDVKNLLTKLKTEKYKLFMTITGGGTAAIAKLLENGGASEVFIGAEIPYSYYTGNGKPKKHVSVEYSQELAVHSWFKMRPVRQQLFDDTNKLLAVGATAVLMKDGPEREDRIHEMYISLIEEDLFGNIERLKRHVLIHKDLVPTRKDQEDFAAYAILQFISDFIEGKVK